MKKIYSLVVLVLIMTLFTSMTAFAGNTTPKISVSVNKKTVKYDVPPYSTKGVIMIPVRQTTEALGGKVDWDLKSKTAWVHFGMTHVELTVGKSEFYIHRDADFSGIPQTVKLTTPIKSLRGRVFVPGINVFESIGFTVNWDSKKRILSITEEDSTDKDLTYTEISKDDITNIKEVSDWYDNNYTKAGLHYIKHDGVMYVLAAAGVKPTGGYTMGINSITYQTPSKAFVEAFVTAPSPDMMVIQMETYPHVLIKLEGHKNLNSVSGEVKENVSEVLPSSVPYEEIAVDCIENNKDLMNWYNGNNQKQGIFSIRDAKYIYALVGAGERPTGGFTININEVFYSAKDTITLNASVTPPGDNVRVMMVITYPSTLIRIESDTVKTIVGTVIDIKTPLTEKKVTLDLYTVATMELFNFDQVKLKDLAGNEKDDIMKSYNEATIDENSYIEMITGNILKVTTTDGYTINFTSYGSNTNVIANIEKDGAVSTLHLVAPVIARTLLQ
jgi:hypothetical protein